MFHGIKWTCGNGNGGSEFSVEQLVQQILDNHQTKPQPRTHSCLCNGAVGSAPHKCNSTKHRIISPKVEAKSSSHVALTEVQNISSIPSSAASSSSSSSTSSSSSNSSFLVDDKNEVEPSKSPTPDRRPNKISKSVPSPTQSSVSVTPHSSNEVSSSSSSSESHIEVPDTTQHSPLATNSGFYGDGDGLSVATVTCSLPQNAVIFMAGLGGSKQVSMGGQQQFMSLSATAQGLGLAVKHELSLDSVRPNLPLPSSSHDISSLGPGTTPGLSGLTLLPPGSLDSTLVLSGSNVDPPHTMETGEGVTTLPTPSTFDPDAFLNSPKQGQTYGGGSNKDSGSLMPASGTEVTSVQTGVLVQEIKSEGIGFECSGDDDYNMMLVTTESIGSSLKPTNQLLLSTEQTNQLLLNGRGKGRLISTGCLSPSTTLESMDFSSLYCQKTYSNISCSQLPNSPSTMQTNQQQQQQQHQQQQQKHQQHQLQLPQSQNVFFNFPEHPIKEEQQQQQPQNLVGSKAGSPQAITPCMHSETHPQLPTVTGISNGVSTIASSIPSPTVKSDPSSPSPFYPYPAELPALGQHDVETAMDTSGVACSQSHTHSVSEIVAAKVSSPPRRQFSTTNVTSSGSISSLGARLQPGATGLAVTSDVPGSRDLYGLVQGDVPGVQAAASTNQSAATSNMEINLEQFDLTFDSQFPDLMADFMASDSAGVARGLYNLQDKNNLAMEAGTFPCQGEGPERRGLAVSTVGVEAFGTMGCVEVATSIGAGEEHTVGMLVTVTDFSPEWSYPEGGVKVLITGPWNVNSDGYSCLFDQLSVPATLIQTGVLRCYCPAHEAGLVALQMVCEGQIISNTVVFEYRARNALSLPATQHDWLSLDDNQFRMSILERLEQMERRMAEMTATQQKPQTGGGEAGSTQGCTESAGSFEERIILVCEKMMCSGSWGRSERLVHSKSFRGMTLLHLAAAQGYTHLIHTLIKWRGRYTESIDLECEVDPLNVDHFSCTPLMWACALGHVEAASVLYQWNGRALSIPDSLGRLPLSVARARGHVRLAACLEDLQRRQGSDGRSEVSGPFEGNVASWGSGGGSRNYLRVPSPSLSQLSTSPDTGLSVLSSSVSSPSVSETQSPLSIHSSPGRDSPLPSPNISPPPFTPSQDLAAQPSAFPTCPPPAFMPGRSPIAPTVFERPSQGLHCTRDEEMDLLEGPQPPVYLFPAATLCGRQSGVQVKKEMVQADLLSFNENLENEELLPTMEMLQVDMITLAEQIIQATPERIKQENFTPMDTPLRERQGNHPINQTMAWLTGYLGELENMPSFSQHRSLYNQPLTPASNTSLSPVNSPLNDIAFERIDTPTAADWSAFLNASNNGKMENEFSQLTLSEHEQRELYEAARIIQTAFRKYKRCASEACGRSVLAPNEQRCTLHGRRLREQQDMAAAVIQRCYRKYKQLTWIALKYALYKKMTQAAILIQSKFRSYYEQKRFQQSRRAAVLIQQYYRSYKEYEKLKQGRRGALSLQQRMRWAGSHSKRGNFLTKNQDQAARKIMRFLRRSRHRMRELKQEREVGNS
uniref:calmodulin-binding transcription activator 1-like isoform X2 n=1 Tax=Myxine glutinosa TaxID=7769 RepID=UPI00358E6804